MNITSLQQFSPKLGLIKDIRIDSLELEACRIDIIHLSELREPTLVLLSKCEQRNNYGGCEKEQYLTLCYFDNACCENISNEIILEAECFYVLHSYPIEKEKRDVIYQAFATNLNKNLLQYPVTNPFQ